jgi:hypothetical protein
MIVLKKTNSRNELMLTTLKFDSSLTFHLIHCLGLRDNQDIRKVVDFISIDECIE